VVTSDGGNGKGNENITAVLQWRSQTHCHPLPFTDLNAPSLIELDTPDGAA
jgi:hypothetical protein